MFALFFCLFIVCRRRLSFSSSSRVFLRAAEVSRKGRGRERGRGELTDLFCKPEQDVGLEVVHREEVGAGVFCQEWFSTTTGGGALEGP